MKTFDITTQWWQLVVIALSCYLIGCFNFAKLISRFKKRDITKIGSGNPGTMNMSREFGLKIGFITFLCDAFKGGVPALRNGGVCLETGNLADSPNHDNFPSCIYGPDRDYDCLAVFKFSVEA